MRADLEDFQALFVEVVRLAQELGLARWPHGTVVGYHSGMLDIPLDAVVDRENFDSCRRARSRRARRTPSNPGWRTRLFVLAVMTFVAAAPG